MVPKTTSGRPGAVGDTTSALSECRAPGCDVKHPL